MVYLDLHERFVSVRIFRWSYEICHHLNTPFPSSSSGFPDDSSQFTWTFSRYQDFQVTLMSPWYPVFYTAHLDLPECLAGIGIFVWSYKVHCHLDTHFPDSSSGFPDGLSELTRTFGRYRDFRELLRFTSPWYPIFQTVQLDLLQVSGFSRRLVTKQGRKYN